MSDSTLLPGGPDSDLLFAALALQLDFVARADLLQALELWSCDRSLPLSQVLVDRRAIAPHRRRLLDNLLTEYLIQHDMDASRGLAAACAARQETLDLARFAAPAMHGSLPTLASAPNTLAGPLLLEAPSSGVGASTSAGKRFRIIRPHAQGALGQVFLAHDDELNRQVALKEIQSAYSKHKDSRARFMLEAEITGSLEHPGIVPVYGLGLHPDGRPYYAMRFIRGESLHEAISRFHAADGARRDPGERALALRGLLGRFVSVCNAIAYAHARGVVHRDIKPSNIMLGPYGETLVVDWGLAKTFTHPQDFDTTELPIRPMGSIDQATMLGQAIGTPSFMAPEAAAGKVDQVGQASDIYSLGCTLYAILTGRPPYQGTQATAILEQVERNDFPPPRRVKRAIPPALEAVVLKAMATLPDDRYRSVTTLAQDVERWLADEPVEAYHEPFFERARRWMRRHRPLVTAAAALLLTTLVGLGVVLILVSLERERTKSQKKIAEDNFAMARKAVDECFEVADKDPLLQQEKMREVRHLLLGKALPFYQGFLDRNPDRADLSFDVGRSHFRVALITSEVGSKKDAIKSYERARDIFAALVEMNPLQAELRADLAKIHNNLGLLLKELGDRQQALGEFKAALALRDRLAGEDSNIPEYQKDLADTYTNLGDLERDLDHAEQAHYYMDIARATFQRLVRDHRKNVAYRVSLGRTLHNVGRLLAQHGDVERALEAYREAESILEAAARDNPHVGEYRGDLARTLIHIAVLPYVVDSEEARRCDERAMEICTKLTKEYPGVAVFRFDLSCACDGLGQLLRDDSKRSIALHSQAALLLETLIKEHPEDYSYPVTLAGTYLNLGRAHLAGPRPQDAFAWFDRVASRINALPYAERVKPDPRSILTRALRGRAETLCKLGRHADSIPVWEEAIRMIDPPELDDLLGRAGALARAGRYREAAREANTLLKRKTVNNELLYELACIYSLSASVANRDTNISAVERKRESDKLASKAVTLLDRAREKGFFKSAKRRDDLNGDEDLNFLRERDDYREFIRLIAPKEKEK